MLDKNKHIHFVGIGGAGMSALAEILLERGFRVSGSDIKETITTERIRKKKGIVFIGHKQTNIKDADLVIFSSCIRRNNPELIFAGKKDIPIWHRSQLLNELIKDEDNIAVTGAHGKTTTSSMIFSVLKKAGLAPSCIIGGELCDLSSNAFLGNGSHFVVEADESDGSFLNLTPKISVITNIDREHLDYYKNFDAIICAFREFIRKSGFVVCLGDDPVLKGLLSRGNNHLTFGFGKDCDIRAIDIDLKSDFSRFQCILKNKRLGRVEIPLPGAHNILNALASIGVCFKEGLDFGIISGSLAVYGGVKRRFQIKIRCDDILLIDDYAHHPSEIKATIDAARRKAKKRLICIFQPHRFSRTKFLADEFAGALSSSDYLVLTDIYPASEKPIKGISTSLIYERVKKLGHRNVFLIPKDKIIDHILDIIKSGDLILNLGAGDIEEVGEELVKSLRLRYGKKSKAKA